MAHLDREVYESQTTAAEIMAGWLMEESNCVSNTLEFERLTVSRTSSKMDTGLNVQHAAHTRGQRGNVEVFDQ
jgi:hypothetical protein